MPTARQRAVALVTRRYPCYSGCGTLASRPWVRRLAGSNDEVAWARVHGGQWVCAPLDDYLGRAVYFVGENDRKITWVLSRLVRPGDTVLDVGANIGLLTLPLAAMVGPAGHVHAFEPIPRLQELVSRALARNGTTNVTLHRYALGAREGVLPLAVPRGHAGAATFVAERRLDGSDAVEVPVRTLSSVLAELRLRSPARLVKIDVEGFEHDVLTGAVDAFREHPPFAVLIEFDDPGTDPRHHPNVELLESLGYDFLAIPRRYWTVRGRRLDLETARPDEFSHDLVAVRRGADYEEAARLLRAP